MIKHFRSFAQHLIATVALLCVAHAHAAPINLKIVSGSAWRSTDMAPSDWNTVLFDDSAWRHAYAPYPNNKTRPADIVNGATAAQLMWDWPGPGVPDGRNGPNEAWFRYSFDVAFGPDSLPLLAQAYVIADDDFELFVNGVKYNFAGPTALDKNKRLNDQPMPLLADFTRLLRDGTNVLAIHAANGSLAAPSGLLNEYVFFDGKVVTVPEPGTMALLLFGTVCMTATLRRARRRE